MVVPKYYTNQLRTMKPWRRTNTNSSNLKLCTRPVPSTRKTIQQKPYKNAGCSMTSTSSHKYKHKLIYQLLTSSLLYIHITLLPSSSIATSIIVQPASKITKGIRRQSLTALQPWCLLLLPLLRARWWWRALVLRREADYNHREVVKCVEPQSFHDKLPCTSLRVIMPPQAPAHDAHCMLAWHRIPYSITANDQKLIIFCQYSPSKLRFCNKGWGRTSRWFHVPVPQSSCDREDSIEVPIINVASRFFNPLAFSSIAWSMILRQFHCFALPT